MLKLSLELSLSKLMFDQTIILQEKVGSQMGIFKLSGFLKFDAVMMT